MSNSWNDQALAVTSDYSVVPTGPLTLLVGGQRIITLPLCASILGREVVIINDDDSAVTINCAGSDEFNTPAGHANVTTVTLWSVGEIFRGIAVRDAAAAARWFTQPQLVHVAEASRGTTTIVDAGTSTSGANVDFSPYVPPGAYQVLNTVLLRLSGNGSGDRATLYNTAAGGATDEAGIILRTGYTNLSSGVNIETCAMCWWELEDDRDTEYTMLTNSGATPYVWIWEPHAYMRI